MIASPTRWMSGCSFDSNVAGSTGHQPDSLVRPACCARGPADCAGMTLATAALNVDALGDHRSSLHVDRLHAAGELRRQPFDHARIVPGPGVLEHVLRLEGILRVEDQDLRPRLVLLEIVRDHRRALVGGRRAAERIRRNDNHENAAVLHAFQLPTQQLALRPGVPGMRHDLGRRLVVALDCAELEGDARSKHEPVVGEPGAALQLHGLATRDRFPLPIHG